MKNYRIIIRDLQTKMVSVWSFFIDLVKKISIKYKLLRICTGKKKKRALTVVYYYSLFTKRDSCIQEEKLLNM